MDKLNEDRNRKADAPTLRKAKQYKYFVILPDDAFKNFWDMFINLILLFVCFVTPYRIALIEDNDLGWTITDYLINIAFTFDMILTFFMAYYDYEYILIDTKREIACNYLKTWFPIDFISIFPFDLVFQTSNFAILARLSKIPR